MDMEYNYETVSVEELLIHYIDILYEDIQKGGIYPVEDLDINKPGVPYPIAKSVLKYFENLEEYEKCHIVNEEIESYKKLQKERADGKQNLNKIQ